MLSLFYYFFFKAWDFLYRYRETIRLSPFTFAQFENSLNDVEHSILFQAIICNICEILRVNWTKIKNENSGNNKKSEEDDDDDDSPRENPFG